MSAVGSARPRLLTSHEASRAALRTIGGKAAGLVRLGQLGVRVPAWVVIPVGCNAEIALGETVADAITLLGDGDLAVRSSAVGEDGAQHSFAGQFATVLNVRGEAALSDAVRACWASASSAHATDYWRRTRETQSRSLAESTLRSASDVGLGMTASMAVVIQRMVAGDASGVLFTTDPMSGDATRVRISACRGLGDRLVSGEADADEIVTDRAGRIIESRLCSETPAIDAKTVQSLVRESIAIAAAEGSARDIEWTVSAGEIWYLQSRPITGRPETRVVWDNSNIQESYSGVTTPLTFSFARAAYAAVYTQTMRVVGISERVIDEHRDVVNGLLGLIHGRVYYNINNWYRGLLLLPAFRRNKTDMERMMGVEEPVDFVEDETPTWVTRLSRAPTMVRTALGLARRFATLERDTAAFLARFDALVAGVSRSTIDTRSLGELAELLRLLRRDGIERWTTPIINDFRVMMVTGRLRRLVARAADDDVDRVLQTLLGGADVAVSSAPAMLMLRMADVVRRSPSALDALSAGEPDGLDRAAAVSPEVASLLAELLAKYGDRCMGELELESRSLRDDSSFVGAMVLNYVRSGRRDADALARQARERRTAVEASVLRRASFVTRQRMRRALRSARNGIRAREAMRLARAQLFGIHRQIYRAIGARLHEQRRLDDPSDVFYLTVDEIAVAIESDVGLELAVTARARRATFAGFSELPAPNRILTPAVPDPFAPTVALGNVSLARSSDDRVLRGLGCSAGIAEGPVRIVTGPDDDLAIDGHVLVATRTDPGWSPLFHAAAAIVVERGSVLSHSAVLARELGLPAVAGIPGLVASLRDGERVRVDGAAGTVERLDVP